jgi:hypothetical protein
MDAIYSNGGNRWNILGFNFTKRDALSSVYKISMAVTYSILYLYKHTRTAAQLEESVDLSLRLLSDYFTVAMITGRYTSIRYFLSIKFQRCQWQCWKLEILQRFNIITVRVALFTSKVCSVCSLRYFRNQKISLFRSISHLSIK